MKKVKSYVRQFESYLKGDNVRVQSERAYRSAKSAFEVEIAVLNGELVKMESQKDKAEDAYKAARFNNGKPIEDLGQFKANLINAYNELQDAKTEIEELKELQEFYKEQLELADEEVEDVE